MDRTGHLRHAIGRYCSIRNCPNSEFDQTYSNEWMLVRVLVNHILFDLQQENENGSIELVGRWLDSDVAIALTLRLGNELSTVPVNWFAT